MIFYGIYYNLCSEILRKFIFNINSQMIYQKKIKKFQWINPQSHEGLKLKQMQEQISP